MIYSALYLKLQDSNEALFKITCAILAILIAFYAVYICINPIYATSFNEYYFKYLPGLIDGNLYTIFDGGLLGDPRPRTFSTLLTLVNINLRELLYTRNVFLPSISVNWLIYPASIFAIYKAALKAFNNNNVALACTVIFASSPAALDMLCNFYIPAKPLTLLFTILSISFFGSLLEFNQDSSASIRKLLSILGLWFSIFLCMVSDETGIFIPLFLFTIYFNKILVRDFKKIIGIFLICIFPYLIYLLYSLYVLPLINNQLGQASLSPIDLAVNGIFPTLFEFSSAPIWNWKFDSFLALFENIISDFLLPAKINSNNWWTSEIYFGLLSFNIKQQIAFSISVCLLIYFYLKLNLIHRRNVIGLIYGFIIFCFIESFVLKVMTPYLIYSNYYANQGSIWMSLLLGLILGGAATLSPLIRSLGIIVIVLISSINFTHSIKSNPFAVINPPTFKEIKEIQTYVRAYKFKDISSSYGFPMPQYKYAFEMEIYRRHLSGEIIDLVPHALDNGSIIKLLPINHVQDGSLRNSVNFLEPMPIHSKFLRPIPLKNFPSLITEKKVKGISENWNYIRTYNSNNTFNERTWYQGIVRIWKLNGSYIMKDGSICFFYSNLTEECFTKLFVNSQNHYFGFDSEGKLVTRFWINDY
jgi:hypothetical protein